MLLQSQASDHCGSSHLRAHDEGIQLPILLYEAEVVLFPVNLLLRKPFYSDKGGTFTRHSPWSGAVHSLRIDGKPFLQFLQKPHGLFVDGSVGSLQDIQKQRAVFRNGIHQNINDMSRRLVFDTRVVEPFADTGLGLPGIGGNVRQLASLDIQCTHPEDLLLAALLGVDRPVFSVAGLGLVIQVGNSLQPIPKVRIFHRLIILTEGKPAVGVQKVWLVGINDFLHAKLHILCQPYPLILFSGLCDMLKIVMVKVAIRRVISVIGHTCIRAVGVCALVGAPPCEGCSEVLRHTEGQVILLCCRLPHTADILVRSHLHRIEPVKLRRIVKEMVMMRRLRHKIARAGLIILFHECIRVKVLSLPQSADVLISKLGRMPVMPQVILILVRSLNVHVSGIPVAEHRNRLRSPVTPDTELYIPKPVGTLMFAQ